MTSRLSCSSQRITFSVICWNSGSFGKRGHGFSAQCPETRIVIDRTNDTFSKVLAAAQ